jgi:hypothetical protein
LPKEEPGIQPLSTIGSSGQILANTAGNPTLVNTTTGNQSHPSITGNAPGEPATGPHFGNAFPYGMGGNHPFASGGGREHQNIALPNQSVFTHNQPGNEFTSLTTF